MWWGKYGNEGFGEEKLNQLNKQLSLGVSTYVYLFELGSPVCYRAEILQLTQNINEVEIEKIPEYYRDVAEELCELFLKLTKFQELDRVETITTLTLASNPDNLGSFHKALRGQSSRFYVHEGEQSLKEVFEYANTYKKSSKPKTRTQRGGHGPNMLPRHQSPERDERDNYGFRGRGRQDYNRGGADRGRGARGRGRGGGGRRERERSPEERDAKPKYQIMNRSDKKKRNEEKEEDPWDYKAEGAGQDV